MRILAGCAAGIIGSLLILGIAALLFLRRRRRKKAYLAFVEDEDRPTGALARALSIIHFAINGGPCILRKCKGNRVAVRPRSREFRFWCL